MCRAAQPPPGSAPSPGPAAAPGALVLGFVKSAQPCAHPAATRGPCRDGCNAARGRKGQHGSVTGTGTGQCLSVQGLGRWGALWGTEGLCGALRGSPCPGAGSRYPLRQRCGAAWAGAPLGLQPCSPTLFLLPAGTSPAAPPPENPIPPLPSALSAGTLRCGWHRALRDEHGGAVSRGGGAGEVRVCWARRDLARARDCSWASS